MGTAIVKAALRGFAFFVLLVWLVPAFAQQQGAEPESLQAQYDAAFQEVLRSPGNLDVMFKFAGIAVRLGNYEAAISTLERMLLFNPELPRVRLELGVLYFRLGSFDVSRSYLKRAIEGKDVPQEVRTRVEAFLDEIDKRSSRNQFSGSVFFGARYQTNANAGPGSADVRAAGFDAVLEDEFLGQDDFNVFASAVVQHDLDLHTQENETWRTIGRAYWSRQFSLRQFDVGVLEMTTGPRLAVYPDRFEDLSFRPYLLAGLVTLERARFFYTLGGGFQVRKPIGQRIIVDGGYELRRKEFRNTARRPNSDGLSGYEHAVGLGGRYAITEAIILNLHFSFVDDDARVEFNSNTEFAVSAGISARYDAPFQITAWPWQSVFSVSRIITNYSEPDPAVDPNIERLDHEWRLTLTNSFGLTEDWSIILQLQRVINDSNLSNFEFDNDTVLIGGSWRF